MTQNNLEFHPSRSRGWVAVTCCGLLVVVGLGIGMAAVGVGLGDSPDAAGGAICIGSSALFILGLGFWLLRHAVALFRMVVRIEPEHLRLVAHTWAVWRGRRIVARDIPWEQVHGVRLISYPNPYAEGGVDQNFVIHTAAGTFVVNSLLWRDASRIADQILARVGKSLNELPDSELAADVPGGVGNKFGELCLHGLGWLSIVMGVVSSIAVVGMLAANGPKNWAAIGALSGLTGTMLTAGRSLTRWRARGLDTNEIRPTS